MSMSVFCNITNHKKNYNIVKLHERNVICILHKGKYTYRSKRRLKLNILKLHFTCKSVEMLWHLYVS